MSFGKISANKDESSAMSAAAKRRTALIFIALLTVAPLSYNATSGKKAALTILPVNNVIAIGYEQGSTNLPENVVDGDLGKRWSNEGTGCWITLDLSATKTISYLDIAWFMGDIRKVTFEISVSTDNSNFVRVY
jgi:hypothetical protein